MVVVGEVVKCGVRGGAYDKSMAKTSNMAAARRQRESCAGLEDGVAVHG